MTRLEGILISAEFKPLRLKYAYDSLSLTDRIPGVPAQPGRNIARLKTTNRFVIAIRFIRSMVSNHNINNLTVMKNFIVVSFSNHTISYSVN